jgi:low affinity Fe/Cu permease
MREFFHILSVKVSALAGSVWAFPVAVIGIFVWFITGPYYSYSDTWLIVISTIATIITFLMVFSIQNTQNRDTKAIHLKLNELITSSSKARNLFVGLESMADNELEEIDEEFKKILDSLAPTHALRKLHTEIKNEKAHRASR